MSTDAKNALLATSGQILAKHGHLDFNQGQVSARTPDPSIFTINKAEQGLDELCEQSFVELPVDSNMPVPRIAPPEYSLHQAIYTMRPDVNAVVHTHSPAALLIGASGTLLRPISHEGALFADQMGLYTDSSCTILDYASGKRVAEALANYVGVFMQNHGSLIAADSIQNATVLMLMLERASRLELDARAARINPTISSMSDVEAKKKFNFSPAALRSFWKYESRVLGT